jgi:hypothetical protein
MAHSLRRFLNDATHSWRAMPKRQALRWYAAVLRHAPTVLRERKFYSADREMRGKLRFFLLGRTFTVDVDAINSTSGNGSAFLREFFVRQIYFREFNHVNFDACLDLGCNTGVVSSLLKQMGGPLSKVYGVDPLTYPGNTFRANICTTPESPCTKVCFAENPCARIQPPYAPCATHMSSTLTTRLPSNKSSTPMGCDISTFSRWT